MNISKREKYYLFTVKTNKMKKVTQTQVRLINTELNNQFKTLGGCISLILQLDKKEETEAKEIISFLVKCKKDKDIYQALLDTVKPHHKTGNYNKYSVIQAVAKILNNK